jgi:N-methylhydantoinase A
MSTNRVPAVIAIDTGGTFTDCMWAENGRLRMLKVFSTPHDPSFAIIRAIKQTKIRGAIVLLHGTTVATNTLLQRKGARIAFVTTRGFEDTIEIGRQNRPKLYDFFFDRIPPLVPAELRFGVDERVGAGGESLREPRREQLNDLTKEIKARRPQAIAVSLLFSFANPAHEQQVARALSKLRLPLSLSHQLLPEFREYERSSTVVMNAYLQPAIGKYLDRLAERVRGHGRGSKVFLMQSSGGIAALSTVSREPVRTLLSGPAGGVAGAAAMALRSGFDRIITFDMGGTSTDVALVDGSPRPMSEGEIAGLPVRVPMLDIHTVGAGGGSIARFDSGGALRVGPESAGAQPGPICYGLGTEPTVTDANLLLNRIRPEQFLGGNFKLDVTRTRNLVAQWLRKNRSSLTLEQFALGVVRVVNATMERALRAVSIERGYDSRDFTLVAFGGAGGLHACELATALGMPRVIVPALPGALSAYGILVSDVIKDYSRTVLWRLAESRLSPHQQRSLAQQFAHFRKQAEEDFSREGWGAPSKFLASADCRYRGQGYELNVPIRNHGFLAGFHREHKRRYGYSHPEKELEIVTLRLRAALPRELQAGFRPNKTSRPVLQGLVFFGERPVPASIFDRDSLTPQKRYPGPAVITEYSATTIVPPGWSATLDSSSNLILQIKK